MAFLSLLKKKGKPKEQKPIPNKKQKGRLKITFLHVETQSTIFGKFSFLCNLHTLHTFCGSQTVKSLLETPSKNTLFNFWFSPVPAETPIFVVLYVVYKALKKNTVPKTDNDNINESAFLSPSKHNRACNYSKNMFDKIHIFPTHPEPYFTFLFLFLQHKKAKTLQFSFRKPHI